MTQATIAEELAGTELFAGLDPQVLEILAARVIERPCRRGQILFHQGDPGDSLFVLAAGRLKVVVSAVTGQEMVLTTLKPPDTFGELSLVDGLPRSASVEALEQSRVLIISSAAWKTLIDENPVLTGALQAALSRMLRRLTDQAADFVFLDLPGRVAKLLMQAHADAGGAMELDLHLTQGDIARMVGGSRQAINQILGNLSQRGYIEVDGRNVIIKNLEALERRAGIEP